MARAAVWLQSAIIAATYLSSIVFGVLLRQGISPRRVARPMMANDLDAAEQAFADALIHAPPVGRTIHVYRGELALLRGLFPEARRDLERSLEINPERLSASLLLGLTLSASGEVGLGHARKDASLRE